MSTHKIKTIIGKVFILVAPGFEESTTVRCLTRLRDATVSVSLVGTMAGLISGARGVVIQPDYTVGEVTAVATPKIIFVPDGKKSVSSLLADPRVHRLIQATVENQGTIAAMPFAASKLKNIVSKSGVENPPIIQSNGNIKNFTDRLINLASS